MDNLQRLVTISKHYRHIIITHIKNIRICKINFTVQFYLTVQYTVKDFGFAICLMKKKYVNLLDADFK